MIATDHDLLGQYAGKQSQDAFTELVNRHLNLVYSAAVRQVRSPQLAEEVSQTVFTQLAHHAARLKPDTILTAWLYQVTRNAAVDVVRREARRQAREQIAFQMSDMNDSTADWTSIEPMLDEAMQSLEEADRTAILLRYFENKSLREVGEAIGATEDAAQKRVSRAVERLRHHFSANKVTIGASGLVLLLSANAIQAAPSGLATSIATGATIASVAAVSTTAVITKTIAMTTVQKAVIATGAAVAIAIGFFEAHEISTLRSQVQSFEQERTHASALSNKVATLQEERDAALAKITELARVAEAPKKGSNEVLKLRGEVGRLRQEKAALGSTSALSKITADPETVKVIRNQQKYGMGIMYSDFAKKAKLTKEQTDKLNDVLADHIMANITNVTTLLRDKAPTEDIHRVFDTQQTTLDQQVSELLGPEQMAAFHDYTQNLAAGITAYQFKEKLSGTDTEKTDKSKQLEKIMLEEQKAVLAAASLPADFQVLPILNFNNFVSQAEEDSSLKVLNDIYQNVIARSTFLSPEELKEFKEFTSTAIKNNHAVLSMNRTMMAPIGN